MVAVVKQANKRWRDDEAGAQSSHLNAERLQHEVVIKH